MATQTSLTNIRQTAGRFLGGFDSGSVNSSGNSATTAVISKYVTSLSVSSQFVDWYFCCPALTTTDAQSRVVSSFTPSTGTLTLDRAYSGSTALNSALFEVHALVPPEQWVTLINDALKNLVVLTEFTFTPSADVIRHDMTTSNTWLTNPMWVRQLGFLGTNETRTKNNPYNNRWIRGWAESEALSVYLNTPNRTVSTGETWYARVFKPAYFHCRPSGGNYGDQSGLSLETDECPIEPEFVAWAAICMAFQQNILDWGTGDPDMARKREDALKACMKYAQKWELQVQESAALRLTRFSTAFGPSPYSGAWGARR